MTHALGVLLAVLLLVPACPAIAEVPATSLAAGEVLRGRFQQERFLTGLEAPLRSEGQFILAPNHGLIWRVEKPFSIITVITRAGMLQKAGDGQAVRLSAERLPFLTRLHDVLRGALAGDWNSLGPQFDMKRSGDDRRWQVELAPRKSNDASMPFKIISLSGGRFVENVRLTKANGDVDTLRFTEQTLSKTPLTPEERQFLEHAGQ